MLTFPENNAATPEDFKVQNLSHYFNSSISAGGTGKIICVYNYNCAINCLIYIFITIVCRKEIFMLIKFSATV